MPSANLSEVSIGDFAPVRHRSDSTPFGNKPQRKERNFRSRPGRVKNSSIACGSAQTQPLGFRHARIPFTTLRLLDAGQLLLQAVLLDEQLLVVQPEQVQDRRVPVAARSRGPRPPSGRVRRSRRRSSRPSRRRRPSRCRRRSCCGRGRPSARPCPAAAARSAAGRTRRPRRPACCRAGRAASGRGAAPRSGWSVRSQAAFSSAAMLVCLSQIWPLM